MKLLSIIPSLDPATGGPAENATLLDRNFRRLGYEHKTVTMDNASAPWLATFKGATLPSGPIHGKYAFTSRLLPILRAECGAADGVILHHSWQYSSLAALLALKHCSTPFVLIMHGNLDPYFIRKFPLKHIKKTLHYRLIEVPLQKSAKSVLFTCEEERRLASQSYKPVVGCRKVIRYGIDPPAFQSEHYIGKYRALMGELEGKEVLLFFGRIHPKKGCDLIIEALSSDASTKHVHLLMVGPCARPDLRWQEHLKSLIRRNGLTERVSWLGPVYGDDKWFLFSRCSAFILPSHMENFGIAVVEAMSQGLPVLVSDKVNIFREIADAGAGLVEVDTSQGTRSLVQRWLATPLNKRKEMAMNARSLVYDRFLASKSAEDIITTLFLREDEQEVTSSPSLEERSTAY